MVFRHVWRVNLVCVALLLVATPASAINVLVDYTYDTNGFFNTGTTQGTQARASLNAAANFFSVVLTDTFDAITVPPPYHSTAPGSTGVVTWSWQAEFQHPSDINPNEISLNNPVVSSNQYIVYAGARSLPGDTAGQGGPGGHFRPSPVVTGTNSFTQSDINNINNITTNFDLNITKRGEPANDFARWGGSITFDNDGSTPWFFNHLALPSGSVTDFYSVAVHELAHTLGFGVSTEWQGLVSGSTFVGSNSITQNGGTAVPLSADLGHWVNGKMSVVYGGSASQEAAMDPNLQNGTRKKFTTLDAAGLRDIGWTTGPPPGINGDYNNNGLVDAADYVLWRRYLGQSVALPNRGAAGSISQADYNIWRANFGMNSGAVSGSGALMADGSVPEPATGLLVVAFWTAAVLAHIRIRQ